MAEARRLPKGRCPLQLGDSFVEGKKGAANVHYHSLRYDFKPASVEPTDQVLLQMNEANETAITIPKYNEAGMLSDATVYKGSKKPYIKECLLVVNHDTGEVRLEQLTSNIQVKRIRGDVNVKQISELLAKNNQSAAPSGSNSVKPQPIAAESAHLSDAEMASDSSNSSESSSDSEGSEEDDITNQLLQKLAEEGNQSAPPPPQQPSQPVRHPQPVVQQQLPPPTHLSQPGGGVNLHSDLHLSDSSDDD